MNKVTSFLVSAIFAAIVGASIAHFKDLSLAEALTPSLIYWYIIWKLFHDKNKD